MALRGCGVSPKLSLLRTLRPRVHPVHRAPKQTVQRESFLPCVSENDRSASGRIQAGLLSTLGTGALPVHAICHIAATCIIIGASVRNLPQLVTCWKQKSAEGISLAALATEVSCYAAAVAYGSRRGYAVTLWGSDLACWMQDSLLVGMIVVLRRMDIRKAAIVVAAWMALQACLFSSHMPMWVLAKFQIIAGLILGLGARMPQILLNFKQGHTGTLAPATFAFNAISNVVNGTIALLLTGDIYVIGTQIWMLLLNVTVLGQVMASGRERKEADETAPKRKVQRVTYTFGDSYDGQARVGYA